MLKRPRPARPGGAAATAGGTELGPRHRVLLIALARGGSIKETAESLQVSERTAHQWLGLLYGRLAARTVAQAIVNALKEGLLSLDEL
jgi:DNA-binding NarL/FixJ family response regulator